MGYVCLEKLVGTEGNLSTFVNVVQNYSLSLTSILMEETLFQHPT